MKLFLFLIFMAVIQLLLVVTFISPEHVRTETKKEFEIISKWFGEDKAVAMFNNANSTFRGVFVESGFVKASYDTLVPERKRDYQDASMNEIANSSFFISVKERLDAFWISVRASIMRLDLMWICILHCLIFIIPTIIDGLMKLEKQKLTEDNSVLNIFDVAIFVLSVCVIGPLIILMWPMAISPTYVGVWALIMSIAAWLTASESQQNK